MKNVRTPSGRSTWALISGVMRNVPSADQPLRAPWMTPRLRDSATWRMDMPTGVPPSFRTTSASALPGTRNFSPLTSASDEILRLRCIPAVVVGVDRDDLRLVQPSEKPLLVHAPDRHGRLRGTGAAEHVGQGEDREVGKQLGRVGRQDLGRVLDLVHHAFPLLARAADQGAAPELLELDGVAAFLLHGAQEGDDDLLQVRGLRRRERTDLHGHRLGGCGRHPEDGGGNQYADAMSHAHLVSSPVLGPFASYVCGPCPDAITAAARPSIGTRRAGLRCLRWGRDTGAPRWRSSREWRR